MLAALGGTVLRRFDVDGLATSAKYPLYSVPRFGTWTTLLRNESPWLFCACAIATDELGTSEISPGPRRERSTESPVVPWDSSEPERTSIEGSPWPSCPTLRCLGRAVPKKLIAGLDSLHDVSSDRGAVIRFTELKIARLRVCFDTSDRLKLQPLNCLRNSSSKISVETYKSIAHVLAFGLRVLCHYCHVQLCQQSEPAPWSVFLDVESRLF